MIDWYAGLVGYDGSALKPNQVYELDQQTGELKILYEKKIQVRGSFDSKIQIIPWTPSSAMLTAALKHDLVCSPRCLYVSGNPSKFLQGHNVFGPSVASLAPVVRSMVRNFPGESRPSNADSTLWPAVQRNVVDTTISIDLGGHNDVHDWLEMAGRSTRSRRERAEFIGKTVYWQRHSRRWALKAYCKFCELDVHGPRDLPLRARLKEYCEHQLRIELRLYSLELKSRGTLHEDLVWDFYKKLEVGTVKKRMELEGSTKLGLATRHTLEHWIAGEAPEAIRARLFKATYYNHRKRILDALNVDISLPYIKKDAEAETRDLAYLRAHEVKGIPTEYQSLLFKPDDCPTWGPSENAPA